MRRLIWVCTVCQIHFYGSPNYSGLNFSQLGGSVRWSLTGDQEVEGLIPARSGNVFLEIDHEIVSVVIFSLPQIQEEQLSVSGNRMCTSTGLNNLQD